MRSAATLANAKNRQTDAVKYWTKHNTYPDADQAVPDVRRVRAMEFDQSSFIKARLYFRASML